MAEDGDPNLPTYSALDEDGLIAWIDLMASRAAELQLPLTHPRFNQGIVWIKQDEITTGRVWSRSAYIPEELAPQPVAEPGAAPAVSEQPAATSDVHDAPDASQPPPPRPAQDPDQAAAIAKAEKEADILMDQKVIIETFFQLVRMGQTGMVALCIHKGLVSPDVTDGAGYDDSCGRQYVPDHQEEERKKKKATRSKWWKRRNVTAPDDKPQPVPPLTSAGRGDPNNGATPLLTAVDAGDAAMVRVLINLGADVNRMARPPDLRRISDVERSKRHKFRYGQDDEFDLRVRRSPLMLAAAQGRMALVRLFFEELHADDNLVAPDGYTALRLAAHGRHREIVALLPARRGGAWLRFSTRHGRSMQRIRTAANSIVWFTTAVGKLVCWHIPKAVLYHIPKELVVLPLGRLAKHLWQHRHDILPAIGRWLATLPRRVWVVVRDLGRLLVDLSKALGRLIARLPQALKFAAQWVVASLKVLGTALANVVGRAVSAVHTAIVAVFTWFRSITLADVLRGLEAVVEAVFVGLPTAVWTCVKLAGRFSLMALNALLGGLAFIIYFIGLHIFHAIIFVPRQLWKILTAIGSSIAAAFHEVVVWVDPKSVYTNRQGAVYNSTQVFARPCIRHLERRARQAFELRHLCPHIRTSADAGIRLAVAGATVDNSIVAAFSSSIPSMVEQVARSPRTWPRPQHRPWTADDALFAVWIGVNDVGNSYTKATADETALINKDLGQFLRSWRSSTKLARATLRCSTSRRRKRRRL